MNTEERFAVYHCKACGRTYPIDGHPSASVQCDCGRCAYRATVIEVLQHRGAITQNPHVWSARSRAEGFLHVEREPGPAEVMARHVLELLDALNEACLYAVERDRESAAARRSAAYGSTSTVVAGTTGGEESMSKPNAAAVAAVISKLDALNKANIALVDATGDVDIALAPMRQARREARVALEALVAELASPDARRAIEHAEAIYHVGNDTVCRWRDQWVDYAKRMAAEATAASVEHDEFAAHEALDRAHLANSFFAENVTKHPYVQANADLKAAAENIECALAGFYQVIAAKTEGA